MGEFGGGEDVGIGGGENGGGFIVGLVRALSRRPWLSREAGVGECGRRRRRV